jgi:hypothetical protein
MRQLKGCEITVGGLPVKVTGQLNFSLDIPNRAGQIIQLKAKPSKVYP